MNFLMYYILFPSIFCRNCQIQCFFHTLLLPAIPNFLKYLNNVFVSNHNSNISSSDNVQKAVDLTIPAKNRRKMNIIGLNFQIKKFMVMTCRVVLNWPPKLTTQLDFS